MKQSIDNIIWSHQKGGRAFEVFWTSKDITQAPDIL